MLKRGLFMVFLLTSVTTWATPSFDCKLASTSIEYAICGSIKLSNLDVELNRKYREFINQTDTVIKKRARDIQRAWLRNRSRACVEKYPDHLWDLKDHYDEVFSNILFLNQQECLLQYYRESINAFDKGLILGKLWLSGYIEDTEFSIPGIDSLSLKLVRVEVDEPGDIWGTWYLTNGTGQQPLKDVYREESGYGVGSNQEIRFFNVYMDVEGHLFYSIEILDISNGLEGDCYGRTEYSLQFVTKMDLPVVPISVSEIVQTGAWDCNQKTDFIDWKYVDGELRIIRKVSLLPNGRNFTKKYFYKYSEFKIVNDQLVWVADHSFQDFYLGNLKSLEEIALSLSPHSLVPAVSNKCETILLGQQRAHYFYFNRELESATYTYWIDQFRNFNELTEYKDTAIYETALVYREYLRAIKAVSNWEERLDNSLLEKNGNSNGTIDNLYDGSLFEENGFPTLHSCPTEWNKSGKWVDSSIYSFWRRRHIDGSLHYFEMLLELI